MILVTGGAGFVGSNLIKKLKQEDPSLEIVSLDNYFTGSIENHLHVEGVNYIKGDTWNAKEILKRYKFDTVYHFGEYSRIAKSFDDIELASQSILQGTPHILELCREHNAKLIYSASSSKFGNGGKDENLSPYSWMKSKMVELIKNYNTWYGLQYEICYFFNVYGPGQIMSGDYATVVGIFQRQLQEGKSLTVVKPGTQTRDFTHVEDIVHGVWLAANRNENHEWHLRSGKSYSIIEVAEMFTSNWELVPERRGERQQSADLLNDTRERLNWTPKKSLADWISKGI